MSFHEIIYLETCSSFLFVFYHRLRRLRICKYAPKHIGEFVGNENNIKILKNMAQTKLYTHTILRGVPGTGKKTLAKLFLEHIDAENVYMIDDYKQISNIIEKKNTTPHKWLNIL